MPRCLDPGTAARGHSACEPLAAAPSGATPWLLSQTSEHAGRTRAGSAAPGPHDDSDLATSSHEDEAEGTRLIALVELARNGDSEAFGQLYDHYHASVYRFLYYRVGSVQLAEDLTARDLLPRAALDELVPLAGQGLRRLADDDRPQPDHRPLQGRPHPPRVRPPRT